MGSGDHVNEAPTSYHVLGGNDTNSYSQNSKFQNKLVELSKEPINELIAKHISLETPSNSQSPIRIADFGCSVGPNAFSATQNIIEAVQNIYSQKQSSNLEEPEFLIFLNDLIGNDFNTLFKYIPPNKQHYVSVLPGSFYGRLLPTASIDIGHCSSALHWISKIPDEVIDENSPAWNGGNVLYFGASNEVKDAFFNQFKRDMDVFFSARAVEVVQGGAMILILVGISDDVASEEIERTNFNNVLATCLDEMVKLGKTTKEKADRFNLPFYFPTQSEVMNAIEANGEFQIERFDKFAIQKDEKNGNDSNANETSLAFAMSHYRAVVSGLVGDHFGFEIIDHLFQLFVEKCYAFHGTSYNMSQKLDSYFVFLKRKVIV